MVLNNRRRLEATLAPALIPMPDAQGAAAVATPVIYKALEHNPTLGRNCETMDAMEWLSEIDGSHSGSGRHRTVLYSYNTKVFFCAEKQTRGDVNRRGADKYCESLAR